MKDKCFFYKKKGHLKANCKKFKTWFENKKKEQGNVLAYMCYESNLIDVPKDSWWLNSGAIVQVTTSLQGLINWQWG